MDTAELNPDRIYHAVLKAGEDWADKKSAYDVLDDVTKSVLSKIMTQHLKAGTSVAGSETMALADPEYLDHLERLANARRAFLFAEVKYKSLQMLSELRRSQESTRRAELRL